MLIRRDTRVEASIGIGLLLLEGIRAFQMSFAPLLIRRSCELQGLQLCRPVCYVPAKGVSKDLGQKYLGIICYIGVSQCPDMPKFVDGRL